MIIVNKFKKFAKSKRRMNHLQKLIFGLFNERCVRKQFEIDVIYSCIKDAALARCLMPIPLLDFVGIIDKSNIDNKLLEFSHPSARDIAKQRDLIKERM